MADHSFHPVTRNDLPMLAEWLKDPVIAEWWQDPDHQLALITEDLDVAEMRQFIALAGQIPVGYAQCFPAHQWEAPHLFDLPADTLAIDVFAAPAGLGQGGAWLRAFGDMLLRETGTLVIDPDPDNLRAIRAYEKAGFSGDGIRKDGEGASVRIMVRRRDSPGE